MMNRRWGRGDLAASMESDSCGRAGDALLTVSNLSVEYPGRTRRSPRRVIEDVTFEIATGQTLALVGESGSGKTTIARAILGLVRPSAGTIALGGNKLTHRSVRERRRVARDLQAVFQDPYSSLNPSLQIGTILTEPLRVQQKVSGEVARAKVKELLLRVGLPEDAAKRYPAHFSGGQRQRIAIARALAVSPKLVICDEPTSSLDVSTQAAVLALLAELQRSTGLSYLFITHDLAVVRHFADDVMVLCQGRLVEQGTAEQVCDSPKAPYTQALVAAAPVPDPILQRNRRIARSRSNRLEEA